MSKRARFWRPSRVPVLSLLLGAATLGAAPAQAQYASQPLPGQGGYELNAALNRLAANPRDVEALLAAGNAALALGDAEAAMGFLGRADQLYPNNPRIKASLASAMVRNQNPYDAIRLFADAERAGATDAMLAGDRGLAYDLVGDNASAQRYYRQALARGASDEIARRLALSLAIAGDRRGFEAALLPQLQRQNPAAWRTRAFALAILGDSAEATRIAYVTMRRDLADGIAPYLGYMPRLTRAQQAAAANFGHFPRAAQIGRDDPRAARFASAAPTAAASRRTGRGADAGLIPAGEPLGRTRRKGDTKAEREGRRGVTLAAATRPAPRPAGPARPAAAPPRPATATARPVTAAVPRPARVATASPYPAQGQAPTFQLPAAPPAARPAPVVTSSGGLVAPRPAPVVASPPAQAPAAAPSGTPQAAPAPLGVPGAPSLVLPPAAAPWTGAAAPSSPAPFGPPAAPSANPASAAPPGASPGAGIMGPVLPPASAPALAPPVPAAPTFVPPPSAPVATAAPRPALAEAFSGFRPPPEEQQVAAAGIDLGRIVPAAPPVAPSHPSRIWVQLATGLDKAALGFDWRRIAGQGGELFQARQAWITPGAQGNRLLVGPFESQAAAQAFVDALAARQVTGSVWTSQAGQPVDPLPAG